MIKTVCANTSNQKGDTKFYADKRSIRRTNQVQAFDFYHRINLSQYFYKIDQLRKRLAL